MGIGILERHIFELHRRGIKVTYSTTPSSDQQLHYKGRNLDHTFTEAEIRVQETEIGKMVTVTLEIVPDDRVVTLTLILPAINLAGTKKAFKTSIILTTHHTNIGGPHLVKGAIQTYRVLSLQGTALMVV